MELSSILIYAAALIGSVMFGLWIVSLLVRDASIVDIFWGLGFVCVAWLAGLLSASDAARKLLVVGLVTVWGLRLAGYLAWRNLGKGEDYRYREMRAKFGSSFWIVSLPVVFGLQGLVMWIVSLPIQAASVSQRTLSWLDAVGVVIWAVGLSFEAIGDWQLARFKRDPTNRGKVLAEGLWRYTRHPNYFGDFLVWWGLFLIAASSGAWWTVVSPLLMSLLLMRVSGVTLLEKSLTARRPEYQAYIDRTSAFFPWPPKESS